MLKCEQNGHLFPTYNNITMDKNLILVINYSHLIYKNKKETWGQNNLFNGNKYHTLQSFCNFSTYTIILVLKKVVKHF
jgi:hypothetical protein